MKTAAKVFLILSMIGAGLEVLLAIFFFALGPAMAETVADSQTPADMIRTIYIVYAIVLLISAAVVFGVAFGAYRALNSAVSHSDLIGWGIAAIIFCGIIPGVLLLCIRDEDLDTGYSSNSRDYKAGSFGNDWDDQGGKTDLQKKLEELKKLHDSGQITDEEYEKARQQALFK